MIKACHQVDLDHESDTNRAYTNNKDAQARLYLPDRRVGRRQQTQIVRVHGTRGGTSTVITSRESSYVQSRDD